jgi:hypothetical protein
MDNKYDKLFKKIKSLINDNESAHSLEDDIYKKFIKDIINNKFKNKNEIIKIAKNINKNVIKLKYNRWYA